MAKTPTRIFDFLTYQLEEFPLEICVSSKVQGNWKGYSTQNLYDLSHQFSLGLLAMGIKAGDKIGILSHNNRPEWNIVDLGALQIGAVDVPVYPTITEEDYLYIFKDAEIKIAFVSNMDLYNKLKNVQGKYPKLESIYIFEDHEGVPSWKEVLDKGKGGNMEDLLSFKETIDPASLATLIYTSGTTGNPKGVMLSHNNFVSNVINSKPRLPLAPGAKGVSFLPLCHVYERMITNLYLYSGTSIYYAESMETIGDNIKEIKPEVFTAVPRLLEKIYEKIMAKGSALSGIKKGLFFWAVGLAEKYEAYGANGWWYEKKLAIARKLIFSKWQEALGGNVQVVASGSAALSPRLARIFMAAGVNIMEGYGLTETSPVVSVNELDNDGFRFGTTGRLIGETEVKIAEDGEILVKGPNVMMGYYNQPEKTAEAIDKDGWFHTGDIGILQEGQYLKITDRKKEMFKTSGGKYIAPQLLENELKQSRFIEQLIVIGENQKHAAALIVPNFDFIKSYCDIQGITYDSNEKIVENQRITDRVAQEIDFYNSKFAQWETIKKFRLLPQEFSIATGELTPTLKLKRKVIMAKYTDLVDELYRD
ncbi:MAG: long-chain acyl-CoA synthetase [Patiriisocius sp.]|jgi:long-chain acyl-CoA synthetase